MNIVFDLDGTLIDSAPDIQAVAAGVLGDQGRPGLSLEETRRFIGEGATVFVSHMMAARDLEASPENHALIYADFVGRYEFAVDKAVFYPGVEQVLAALKEAGHKLGLCTNKPERPARAVMEKMGMTGLFAAFVAGDMLPSRKPDPEMLQQVLRDLGDGAALYVGDSEVDAQTALSAKVPFALFSAGYRKTPVAQIHHNWVFDHYAALADIVAAASANTPPAARV